MTACSQVMLFQALVEAAGEDLNHRSLQGGAEGLVVDMPTSLSPDLRQRQHGDGDPPAYLFDFGADSRAFVLREARPVTPATAVAPTPRTPPPTEPVCAPVGHGIAPGPGPRPMRL